MAGKFLIDFTDARFFIPENDDVLQFVRVTNPFAHSDVGSLLLELGKKVSGATAYCPSYANMAYVVLHTATWRIVAIAFGQTGLAFRLAPASRPAALADRGMAADQIGPAWVAFNPWDVAIPKPETRARLQRWCMQAFTDAAAAPVT